MLEIARYTWKLGDFVALETEVKGRIFFNQLRLRMHIIFNEIYLYAICTDAISHMPYSLKFDLIDSLEEYRLLISIMGSLVLTCVTSLVGAKIILKLGCKVSKSQHLIMIATVIYC